MDWKQKLQSTRDAGQTSLGGTANALIEEQWPKIQLLFQEKVGPAALAAAQNDAAMTALFKNVYPVLPFPVRMVVKEEAFCLSHRTKLLPPTDPAIA